ncbi:hypothetical protein ES288_D03G136200v1 [Gossypium darwinii]|uniref:Uncharacterized protein n=1 Tax=Gossypium darwinii TaxID=34276 RepID=A0A5D2D6L5_GOSDA|nr:hypothetical protein ES288_D03G136200v1 [Gossypium darwinii]
MEDQSSNNDDIPTISQEPLVTSSNHIRAKNLVRNSGHVLAQLTQKLRKTKCSYAQSRQARLIGPISAERKKKKKKNEGNKLLVIFFYLECIFEMFYNIIF